MKTSHFEERIAFGAVETAQRRDESTQRELATFNSDLGSAWLVPPADSASTGHPSGDGGATFTLGRFKTGHSALWLGTGFGVKTGHSAHRKFGRWAV
jgi:hypothetical protein